MHFRTAKRCWSTPPMRGLRARVHALGAEVAGARTLLDEFAAPRDALELSASGGP